MFMTEPTTIPGVTVLKEQEFTIPDIDGDLIDDKVTVRNVQVSCGEVDPVAVQKYPNCFRHTDTGSVLLTDLTWTGWESEPVAVTLSTGKTLDDLQMTERETRFGRTPAGQRVLQQSPEYYYEKGQNIHCGWLENKTQDGNIDVYDFDGVEPEGSIAQSAIYGVKGIDMGLRVLVSPQTQEMHDYDNCQPDSTYPCVSVSWLSLDLAYFDAMSSKRLEDVLGTGALKDLERQSICPGMDYPPIPDVNQALDPGKAQPATLTVTEGE